MVLVKTLPQRSARHGETVCCAGITVHGEWKRLYPVRFRHLDESKSFKRWDYISFKYGRPSTDNREESCRVFEDSIVVDGRLAKSERSTFLDPLIISSVSAAAAAGKSLTLIRPIEPRFFYRPKSRTDLEDERQAYRDAVAQQMMFDDQLTAIEPTPYELKFRFKDSASQHEYTSGDWEAHTMFFNGRKRYNSDAEVLNWMDYTFNDVYAKKGMLFAVGNQAKRPQTWQLLGVIRADKPDQQGFQFVL